MDHRSTLVREVEVPSTLPPMETLTKLTGSVLMKDVAADEEGLRLEGDLLWRGYFEEGGGECLWEGAEFFSEVLAGDARGVLPEIEPEITALRGESLSEKTYRMAFDIRWFDPARFSEQTTEHEEVRADGETEAAAAESSAAERAAEPRETAVTETAAEPAERGGCGGHCGGGSDLDRELEAIGESWRETLKIIDEPEKKTAKKTEQEAAESEDEDDVKIRRCPYSRFCLRYYRTQDGDELEEIAERFSATVAKLKERNRLDDAPLKSGRLLRIP